MAITIELKDVTKEYLDNMGIHEIRTFAREVGVPHPTSLKKQEMIDGILAIRDGKAEPQKVRKAGRPPKSGVGPTIIPVQEAQPAENPEEKKTSNFRTYIPQQRRPMDNRRRFGDWRGDQDRQYGADNADSRFEKKNVASTETFSEADDKNSLLGCEIRSGILEILPDGYGFLRASNFRNSSKDSYVPTQKIKRSGLRPGDYVTAYCRATAEGKPPAVEAIIEVNNKNVDYAISRPKFDDLTPIFPNERLRLEIPGRRNELAARAIDLIAPIGKGQRAMVVSPPKAGKTTLLKMIANSISENSPEVKLMVLLIDERPEEVTDMQRSIKGEVIYSTFDEESDNHIKVAELVLNRAKRMVEDGQDVVILLDSLTRMARANNVIVPSSGKTLSGGVDPVSLYFPKRFFGAARNIENGGSLTIIATALVDTGSRMDDVVYEEFKGTGNMEIHLDRRLSEKRIFPAIDLNRSGTRREELLLTQKELEGAYLIRKLLSTGDNQEAAEGIITLMQKTATNEELVKQLNLQVMAMQKDGYRI